MSSPVSEHTCYSNSSRLMLQGLEDKTSHMKYNKADVRGKVRDMLLESFLCSVHFSRSAVSNSLQPHGL